MSPCACASVSVRGGEKCGDEGGEHEKEPRRSQLEGETALFA